MFHKMAQMIQMHTEKKLLDEVFATYRDVQDAAAEMAQVLPCPRCGKQTMKIQANILTRKLNVSADRLYNDYGIRYESKRTHEGRVVKLTLGNSGV